MCSKVMLCWTSNALTGCTSTYVPNLQVGGQVVTFLTEHLGNPIPSPALFKQIGDRFREAVRSFAEINGIPVLHLNTPDRSRWNDRKVEPVHNMIAHTTQPEVEG